MAAEDRWLTTKEAAVYLGLSGPTALHRLTSERRIAFSQESHGGKCWFRRADLDAFREAHLQPPLDAWRHE
jgi:excisionase family DNA binding protein